MRIEKYIDTSTSNDKSGHINNHKVAIEFTKPMIKINVPHKSDLPLKLKPNVDNDSNSKRLDKLIIIQWQVTLLNP